MDAASGALISLTDELVSGCEPPDRAGRRVLGGVKTERADEPERVELLPLAAVGGSATLTFGLGLSLAGNSFFNQGATLDPLAGTAGLGFTAGARADVGAR